MVQAVILMLLSFIVLGVNGNGTVTTSDIHDKDVISLGKRSDGLMRELVNLLAEQKNERKNLLQRCIDAEGTTKRLSVELEAIKRSVGHFKKQTTRQHTDTQKQIHTALRAMKSVDSITKQHSSQLVKMQNKISAIQKAKGTRKGTAFSIKFKNSLIGTISFGRGDVVKFNKIISNNGNGYNVSTGKFTCKRPGLYFFTCTLISKTNHGDVWIVKNNIDIIQALTTYELHDTTILRRFESGSTSTVLKLSVGDEVWIASRKTLFVEWNSVFSGVLISESAT